MSTPDKKSRDERKAILAQHVNMRVAQGRRIESQDEFRAVLAHGRVIEFREMLAVDDWGRVSIERLPLDRERVMLLAGFALVVLIIIIIIVATR